MLESTLLACIFFYIFYKFWTSRYHYWRKNGFAYVPGKFPFGSKMRLGLFRGFRGKLFQEIYNELAPHPYGGLYLLRLPVLVVRHPDIIKQVMVKDFSNFSARLMFKRLPAGPLAQHLFNLEGEKWRALRVKLTPTFTSGKLKAMFPMFLNCCESLDNLLITMTQDTVDVKEVTSRFGLDIIGTCAFGLELNSIANPDSEFTKFRQNFLKTTFPFIAKLMFINAFPDITEYHMPRLVPHYVEDLLIKVVNDSIEYREKNGLKMNDFLSLLIGLKNKGHVDVQSSQAEEEKLSNIEMDVDIITAQCFIFFAAGFETSSSVQSFCLYELALHTEIQNRLRLEIESVIEKHGTVSYAAVKEMQYLDMVISETIRKYPTLPLLTRRCIKDTVLPEGQTLEAGTRVFIPIWALHHDPQYFPNPDTFDPERFSPDNKSSIVPFSYLPFGEGPRVCIGMRFGLLQTKMGLITILRKYKVEPTEETEVPIKFSTSINVTTPSAPIKLKFKKNFK